MASELTLAEARPSGPMEDRLTPELRLLVEAIRSALGWEAPPWAGEPVDWAVLLRLAARHGLAPLAHAGLPVLDVPAPEAVLARLRAAYLGAAFRTEAWVEPTLRRALGALAKAGLEPIVLKGAALAYTVYPEPALRTLADIDLLLPSAELPRAGAALASAGFHVDTTQPEATHHLRPFYLEDGQVAVELHDRLLPEPHPYAIDLADLWARAELGEIAGVEARVLALPDALLYACVHLSYAHRYRWFPFRTLTDILVIAAAQDEADWDCFRDAVARSRTGGAVYWPLAFASSWLEAPVPERVLMALAPPEPVRRLVGAVAAPRYVLGNEPPPDAGRAALYRMVLDFSLHAARSPGEQLAAYLGSPRRVVRALRAYGTDPRLVARIALAAGRLLSRRRASLTRSAGRTTPPA